MLDVGGESGVTIAAGRPAAEEIERVAPLVARLAATGACVSVDTYKPAVARAAVEAGAVDRNDPSGLIDPRWRGLRRLRRRARRHAHPRAPQEKLDRPRYDDVVDDVKRLLEERLDVARAAGVPDERLLSAPGPISERTRRRRSSCCAGSTRSTSSACRCCSRCRARTSSARSSSGRRASGWPDARRDRAWLDAALTCCACTTSPPRGLPRGARGAAAGRCWPTTCAGA